MVRDDTQARGNEAPSELTDPIRCVDIQLNVKGIKTLYDSFRDYLAVETLDGENKYEAEGFGLQDARKGIIFQSFPPMLYLQLKRYEYDMQLDAMVKVRITYIFDDFFGMILTLPKVNDRFEFPFEIDLGEFLDGTADRTKPWEYELHSVFVHSGNLRCGRNHVLIKPDRSTRWLKFDNDRVTPVTDREVLEENYGGGPLKGAEPQTQEDQDNEMEMSTNAYILAYIRKAAFDEVMAPLTEEDTPLYLSALVMGWWSKIPSSFHFQNGDWMRIVSRWRRRRRNSTRS